MRVLIRKEIDVEKQINLRRLKPLTKIFVAIRKQFSESSFYKSSVIRKQEEYQRRLTLEEENLKEAILMKIYKELIQNNSLKDKNEEAKEIIITIDSKYGKLLFEQYDEQGNLAKKGLLANNEFLPYNIVRVKEHSDLRIAFKQMPYMFRVSKRIIT